MYTVYIEIHSIHSKGGIGVNLFINAAGDKPMYEQVKDGIKQAILSGELKAHRLMPSVRQLSADLNVSMITIKRAYSDLERDGLIYTVAGKGTFVKTEDTKMLQEKHIAEILDRLAEQVTELKKLNVPIERVTKELERIYGGNENE